MKQIISDIIVVAPGSSVKDEVLSNVQSYLKQKPYGTEYFLEFDRSCVFHSASDKQRGESLAKALGYANLLPAGRRALIWGLRGGWGSARLLPELNKLKKPKNTPVLMGISDLTCLHLHWNLVWKLPSIHGPLLDRAAGGSLPDDVHEEMWRVLNGKQSEVIFSVRAMNPKAKAVDLAKSGQSGVMIGGNLASFLSLLSTEFEPRLGKSGVKQFLFLEDIGERGYKIDRMLWQLSKWRSFSRIAGIFFGQFTDGAESPSPGAVDYTEIALTRFAESVRVPVWMGIESGHGERLRPLPLGAPLVVQGGTLRLMNPLAEVRKGNR